jgi:hypothetical protein
MRTAHRSATAGAACIVLGLLVPARPAGGQESARAIVERAVKAHGGHARLAQARADRVKLRGTLFIGGDKVPFVSETTVQLPGQFKNVVELTRGGRKHTVAHLLNGEQATLVVDGRAHPLPAGTRAELQQTLQLNRAMRLVPLLKEGGFTLTALGEGKVHGQPVLGVKVTVAGGHDLYLYFDKGSALLLKSEHFLAGADGKKVRQEAYYGDFRDVGGYRRPGKVAAFRDGNKMMEAELVEARQFERLSPLEFTQP